MKIRMLLTCKKILIDLKTTTVQAIYKKSRKMDAK